MHKINISFVQTDQQRDAYHAIRNNVFVIGQNVPVDIERDAYDSNPDTWHLLATLNDQPAGTVRVTFPEVGTAKIGRLAVSPDARGHGIATMLMEQILDDLPHHGVTTAVLSAQAYLRQFYEGLGFKTVGEEYAEAGIPHVWMEKILIQKAAA